jgi:homoserine dehydrogenase
MRLLFVGFGTVAQGLSELLIEKKMELREKYGLDWKVTGIVDMLKGSAHDPNGLDLDEIMAMVADGRSISDCPDGGCDWDALEMIERAEAEAMLEVTYTDIKSGQPATDHIRTALARGMHVTTTNKGPLALFSNELVELAAANGVQFLYEGTVMAGTPLLNLIRETLAGSAISEMKGILNGTTNYILTQMEAGMGYGAALKQAQELGYAEAVPDADVLGWDALAKVTILAMPTSLLTTAPAPASPRSHPTRSPRPPLAANATSSSAGCGAKTAPSLLRLGRSWSTSITRWPASVERPTR